MNDLKVNSQNDSARGSRWYELVETQRAIQEYERLPAMMDDIWQAHEHGWLPVSMTESRRPNRSLFPPWKWLNKSVVYVVAYRHTGQLDTERTGSKIRQTDSSKAVETYSDRVAGDSSGF